SEAPPEDAFPEPSVWLGCAAFSPHATRRAAEQALARKQDLTRLTRDEDDGRPLAQINLQSRRNAAFQLPDPQGALMAIASLPSHGISSCPSVRARLRIWQ